MNTKTLAEVKMKEVLNFLLCLRLEGSITEETYTYMYDRLLCILWDVIFVMVEETERWN